MYVEAIINYLISYLKDHGLDILWKTFLAIAVFVVFRYVSKRIVAKIRHRIESYSLQTTEYSQRISKLVGNVVFILLMIFTVLAVFQVIGFDVALLMWGISLGVWFAMETTIGNMIAGVLLLMNQKVRLGDYVKFFGKLNMMWTIDEINIRYTVIKTFDKRRVIVPNSVVAATPIQTYKSEPLVRGEIKFTVPRHVLFSQIQEIMVPIINGHKSVVHKDYTSVLIAGFDTSGMQIVAYFFVDQLAKKSAFIVGRELKWKIFEEFKKYGIVLPYKHLTLTVE